MPTGQRQFDSIVLAPRQQVYRGLISPISQPPHRLWTDGQSANSLIARACGASARTLVGWPGGELPRRPGANWGCGLVSWPTFYVMVYSIGQRTYDLYPGNVRGNNVSRHTWFVRITLYLMALPQAPHLTTGGAI
jgi:hypothetical protein